MATAKAFYIILTVCANMGFLMRLIRVIKGRAPLFHRMIVFGVGCAALGRLYETFILFTQSKMQSGFHVGKLGIIGSFLFFISANYGQINSLADDGSKKFRKYRSIAHIAPLAVAGLYTLSFSFTGFTETAVVDLVISGIICQASYFHLKLLIFPDAEGGIIRTLRPFNLMALIYAFLCMAEMFFVAAGMSEVFFMIDFALLSICLLLILPLLERRIRKRKT